MKYTTCKQQPKKIKIDQQTKKKIYFVGACAGIILSLVGIYFFNPRYGNLCTQAGDGNVFEDTFNAIHGLCANPDIGFENEIHKYVTIKNKDFKIIDDMIEKNVSKDHIKKSKQFFHVTLEKLKQTYNSFNDKQKSKIPTIVSTYLLSLSSQKLPSIETVADELQICESNKYYKEFCTLYLTVIYTSLLNKSPQ
ncbi:hypothetical protein AB837_00295 [bacterium AB1]|nr:hypothetical protein AB837_00295 [bacterium AB1]